jgi:hypothetical protein
LYKGKETEDEEITQRNDKKYEKKGQQEYPYKPDNPSGCKLTKRFQ